MQRSLDHANSRDPCNLTLRSPCVFARHDVLWLQRTKHTLSRCDGRIFTFEVCERHRMNLVGSSLHTGIVGLFKSESRIRYDLSIKAKITRSASRCLDGIVGTDANDEEFCNSTYAQPFLEVCVDQSVRHIFFDD